MAAPADSFALSPAETTALDALRKKAATHDASPVSVVPTGLAELDEVLPLGGFARGAVTELASSQGLALSTTVALRIVAEAQREARLRGGESALAALVDPSRTVHGPAVRALGVDTDRLLVVRPTPEQTAKSAVRIVQSRAFSVVVVDTAGVPGARTGLSLSQWVMATRRIALAAEGTDTAVVLLTALEAARPLPLPVSMRVELREPALGRLAVRIAKERLGKVGGWRSVPLSKAMVREAVSKAS